MVFLAPFSIANLRKILWTGSSDQLSQLALEQGTYSLSVISLNGNRTSCLHYCQVQITNVLGA